MCLIVRKETEITVLEKDLVVFKKVRIFSNDIRAIHFPKKYIITRLNEEIFLKFVDVKEAIFANQKATNYYEYHFGENWKESNKLKAIQEGYHFYTDIHDVSSSLFSVWFIAECTIPAGSQICFDETGLGVASNIIINKILPND